MLIILLFLGTAIATYGLFGEKESFTEKIANDKNSQIAIEFSKYIFDYSKKYHNNKFYRKFNGVPLECQEYVWNIIKEINSLPKPTKVTLPAMGKAKRYVYYNIDGDEYCFTVSLIKKRWQFRGIQKNKNK